MKKIIITGSSGYIGSCLFFYLKSKFKIIGIDKKKSNSNNSFISNLLNFDKVNKILKKEKPDFIVHLAAQSLVDEKINKKKYYLNNIIATKNLLKSMKLNKLNNLIFSSTAAVYKKKNNLITEKDTLKPISTYAKTKYECEKLIKKSKINSIILRFFNVCSSLTVNNNIIGEFHNQETHLIPTVVYKNLFKKKVYLYGNNYKTSDGTCVRDYIHIKDVCMAIDKSITYLKNNLNKSEIINIGSSVNQTNLQIIKEIENITKLKTNFIVKKNRRGDIDKLACSISKAKRIINWKPKFSKIKTIINDEIRWVKDLKKNNLRRRFKNYL
jgi:UDP-glucose 4-epimerase